jgi:hypothetical protein
MLLIASSAGSGRNLKSMCDHVSGCVDLYTRQRDGGRYFLDVQPDCAASAKHPAMQSLLQCETSHTIPSQTRTHAHVNRQFCFVTNSPYLASELKAELTRSSEFSTIFRECSQLDRKMHISALLSPRLHATVLRGLHEQVKADGKAYPFSIGRDRLL